MPTPMGLLILYILITLPALGGRAFAVRVLGLEDEEAWALGRTMGLVLVAFPAWWVGVAGLTAWLWVGGTVLVGCGLAGGLDLWRNRPDWRALARAELVFVLASAAVIWLRLERPDILGQEKLMDLGIFASLMRAEAFPPPDMWMAGETLPYYYWGALVWTVPLVLSRIPLDLAYNLVVAAIGGLSASLLWTLGRRAHEGRGAGLIAVLVGLFAGTPDGLRQVLKGVSFLGLDYWHSSRQVTDTITEWPLFTLWLGDLHPHLLSIPLALAAILVAWEAGRSGPRPVLVAVTAVLVGVTWAANPWAMPPTLVAAALLLLCGDGRWHWPDREGWRRWAAATAIAVGGWLAAAPFHLTFHPPFQGISAVFAWTPPLELLLWGGVLLLPVAAASWALLVGVLGGEGIRATAAAATVAAGSLVIGSVTGRPTLAILATILVVLVYSSVSGGARPERPATALAALGVFLLLVPEVLYVVDSYGEKLHRMNTVFKCYVQAWILLSIALPSLLVVGFRRAGTRAAAGWCLAVLAASHLIGMAAQPLTGKQLGIDGLGWLADGDRAIIRYLRQQPRGHHHHRGGRRRLHRVREDLVGVGRAGAHGLGKPRDGVARERGQPGDPAEEAAGGADLPIPGSGRNRRARAVGRDRSGGDFIFWNYPLAKVLYTSPALQMLWVLEKQFPLFKIPRVVDNKPSMSPLHGNWIALKTKYPHSPKRFYGEIEKLPHVPGGTR